MGDVPLGALVLALLVLIALSACCSGTETGMMALNRYRLRHLARHRHRGAVRAKALLERPDRLIGLILLGNNLVNFLAVSVATVIAIRLLGDFGLALVPFVLTPIILIFAEVAPKTLAALHPERIAFPAAYVLGPLMKLLLPVVVAINWLANGVLRCFNVRADDVDSQQLSTDELRTVVNEAALMIPRRHQQMLVSILDLENVTVDDIMVPRGEVNGIDLDEPMDSIMESLVHSMHTRLPVYRGDIDNVVGMFHLRKFTRLWEYDKLTPEQLTENAEEPYFVPAGTPLHTQLRNFQLRKERIGLVVDEYGDVEGLVTLEDLLEEIVGEFTSESDVLNTDVHPQPDGTYLIDGTANIRDLNRIMGWELPVGGPKTLNGLVIEYLETIPEAGTSLLVAGYPVEIVQSTGNAIKTARIKPEMRRLRSAAG